MSFINSRVHLTTYTVRSGVNPKQLIKFAEYFRHIAFEWKIFPQNITNKDGFFLSVRYPTLQTMPIADAD